MRAWITSPSPQFWPKWFRGLAVGIILILISLFFVDQHWAQLFGSDDMVQVWLFHRHITEVGKAEAYLLVGFLSLLYKPWRKKAGFFLACLLTSGLVLHIVKFIIGRERPHKTLEHDPFVFEPFSLHHHFQSFPSGHSQTLFSVATFVAYLYPKSTPWIISLALYLSFTRAITLAHFVSDVWGGAFLGLLVSAVTLRYLVNKYGP